MKKTTKILSLVFAMTVLAVIFAVGTFAAKIDINEYSVLIDADTGEKAMGTCPGSTITWAIFEHDTTGQFLLAFLGEGSLRAVNLTTGEYLQPKYNANVEWKYEFNIPWAKYVKNIYAILIDEGIYAIEAYTFAIHKNVQTVELGKDVEILGNKAFWGCTNLQTIYRTGIIPVTGTLDLTGIASFGDGVFDSCKYFSNIILPTDGSYTLKEKFIYDNTALKEIYIPAACTKVESNAVSYCTQLTAIAYESYDTVAVSGAFSNNNKIPSTYSESFVTVKVEGGDDRLVYVNYMSSLFQIDDTTYVVYTDDSYTILHPNTIIKEETTVYAKKLFEFIGYEVRVSGHNGLRAIYEYHDDAFSCLSGYSISMGVLGADCYGLDPILDFSCERAENTQIIVDDVQVGNILSYSDNTYRFSYVSVGYEKSGKILGSRVSAEIMTRAYVMLKDIFGSETVFYSVQSKKDLNSACEATKEAVNKGKGYLTTSQMAFVEKLLAVGADPDKIYTKDEALTYLTNIYNVGSNILSGQHIGYSPTIVKDTLDEIYRHTGEFPAVLSYDVALGYRAYKDAPNRKAIVAGLVEQFKEYAKQGGLITFCAHTTNPVGGYDAGDNVYSGSLTTAQWDALWSNQTFIDELDGYAELMQAMEDAGIPIFWRPYHEANLADFWWGQKNIPSDYWHYYVEVLWRKTHDYLDDTKGLSNLIWIYSPLIAPSGSYGVLKCYPGDAYVDVMGLDWYTNKSQSEELLLLEWSYSSVWSDLASKGKPVIYGEFGPGSNNISHDANQTYGGQRALNDLKKVYNQGYYMGWVVFWRTHHQSLSTIPYAKTFMADDFVYTLAESREAFFNARFDG